MGEKITDKDVKYIAKLSKLNLQDDEMGKFADELSNILKYIEKLNELDTSEVEPTSHVLDISNVTREDIHCRFITQEDALKNAPEEGYNHFKVPRIIE